MDDFSSIWAEAKAAAQKAAEEQNNNLGPESSRGFDCGFAWVNFPGNTAFARWAKKSGISSDHYPKGQSIRYGKLHSVPTQSVSVHEAAARAARDVLSQRLGTSQVYTGSRLD